MVVTVEIPTTGWPCANAEPAARTIEPASETPIKIFW
jgi:hypothetical protein